MDAGNSAAQVAKPANDAIQLGSPYVTTDSAASLVVLTGQASKTIADQQKAVADAHAKNAQEESAAAKALAQATQGEAKAAYQHAANAAAHASNARTYAKEALGFAADAATAASKATASLARTVEYDRQATEDAAAADKAAGRAEGHAKDARDSADQAALDASAARTAASEAEQAAKAARAAADRADVAATEAEQAAKDAERYAREAQEAAERAEEKAKAQQITTGTTVDDTGVAIGNVFFIVDHIEAVGDPEVIKKDNCNVIGHIGDCVITAEIRFNAVVDLYLCTAPDLNLSQYKCPAPATVFLDTQTLPNQSTKVTHTISMVDFNAGIDPLKILLGDFIECAQKITPGGASGSWGGCAWAAGWFVGGKAIKLAADAVKALDASMKTGIGFTDAWKALRSLGLSEAAVAGIATKVIRELGDACKKTARTASFTARAAGAEPGCWVEVGGPGRWYAEKEGMDASAAAYQRVVTNGVPEGFVYKVPAPAEKSGFVKFDGYQNGTLIDAKFLHYPDNFVDAATGKLRFPASETSTMQKQVKAADGVPVVWYVDNERTATALRHWAVDNKVDGIDIVFKPAPIVG